MIPGLGLTAIEYAKGPSKLLPPTVNRSNVSLWEQAVGTVTTSNVKRAWEQALDRYLELCQENRVYPLAQQTSVNDRILNRMILGRRRVVNFVEKQGILKVAKVRRTLREATLEGIGFRLRVDASLAQLDTAGAKTLTEALRLRVKEGWRTDLDKDVSFFVYNEGAHMSQRWHMGYEIYVPFLPVIPSNYFPSTDELEQCILGMYRNIQQAIRPYGTRTLL